MKLHQEGWKKGKDASRIFAVIPRRKGIGSVKVCKDKVIL